MTWILLHLLTLIFSFVASTDIGRGIITTTDIPYDVININIPEVVWKQALRPTPVLKSPVTIVVPVHVAQDEDSDIDEYGTDDDSEANEVESSLAVNDEQVVQEVVSDSIVAANVTEAPVQDVTQPAQVAGQVIRSPCSCLDGQCGCCTGAMLQRIKMNACGNISFNPEDFVFDVRLTVNNNTVVRRRVSASDPPPICFNPRRAPFVHVCAEISNIRIRNRNAFACLDINADIGGFPVYSASFRCFGLGASGVQTGLKPKPVSNGPAPVNLFGNNDDDDDDGGFIENAADGIFGGDDEGGLFGGGSDDDDGGPLDAIGDAVGDFFEGRFMKF